MILRTGGQRREHVVPESRSGANHRIVDLTYGHALAAELGNAGGGREIIDARPWIDEVERLPEIALGQQIARNPADVRYLQRKFPGQFSPDRDIDGVGVWSLQRLVHSPGDGLAEGRRRLREVSIRHGWEEMSPAQIQLRNHIDAGDARNVFGAIGRRDAAGILDG